jgi:flavin-dependent dehydrogenase
VDSLKRVDGIWKRIKSSEGKTRRVREFVKTIRTTVEEVEEGKKFDVVVCGGTLGILLAATLQQKENNLKVGVIERGKLQGREQEWNVTRKELSVLCALNVLTEEDLDEVICGEFNPIKCGFYDSTGKRRQEENEIVTENVLNCGVSPTRLIEKCRENFELNGGVVFEETSLNGVTINEEEKHECARLDIGSETIEARLVVDAMGFGSPITLQARNGEKPDGVCVVVGTCAEGFDEAKNVSADLIYTCTDISEERQYFWEAFPAELDKKKKKNSHKNNTSNVRTTYMFSYLDAKPERPSIARILDDYWNLMPKYQNLNSLDDVEFKRILFGYFPTYRNSPLKAQFDRVLQIGDASGMQSPLSFGGLACMLRHLPRISLALTEALEADIVDKKALGTINAYQPALSAGVVISKVHVRSSREQFVSFFVLENLHQRFDAHQFRRHAKSRRRCFETVFARRHSLQAVVENVVIHDEEQHRVRSVYFTPSRRRTYRGLVSTLCRFRRVRLPRTRRRARHDVGEEYKRAFPALEVFFAQVLGSHRIRRGK